MVSSLENCRIDTIREQKPANYDGSLGQVGFAASVLILALLAVGLELSVGYNWERGP